MKKAGSSKSKSKTLPISKNTQSSWAEAPDGLAVGYHPPQSLTPEDETLFKAFQSNLLSMISHELRTPLMGILNALSVLAEDSPDPAAGLSQRELVDMARRNAFRLQQTLNALLDLASIESGMFHARLREVDIARIAEGRIQAQAFWLRELGLRLERSDTGTVTVLGDPQRLGRAVDLCLQSICPRAEPGRAGHEPEKIEYSVSKDGLSFRFKLKTGAQELWQNSWTQALVGFEGGVASPSSAFSATLQSEQAFLSRPDEGLGSEFLLIHEIMKLHYGKFESQVKGGEVTLRLVLPELSSEQALCIVLGSRMDAIAPDQGLPGSIALVLIGAPSNGGESFQSAVKKRLFRATDAVYPLPQAAQVAVVMDDCRAEDAPKLLARIQAGFDQPLRFGLVTAPEDGFDPAKLIELAQARLRASTN